MNNNILQAKIKPWIPGLVCALFAIVSGLAVLLLPETKGRPLPVTVEDIENISRFSSGKKKIFKEATNTTTTGI